MSKPRVLVMGLNYAPERTGIAPYTAGMARGLAIEFDVEVLTAHPHYPDWELADGYGGWRRREVIDVTGLTLVPGFIDTHLHVESSLVTPLEFDRCVLPHGVTTAICDPHEIANVLGAEGIRYFQRIDKHSGAW